MILQVLLSSVDSLEIGHWLFRCLVLLESNQGSPTNGGGLLFLWQAQPASHPSNLVFDLEEYSTHISPPHTSSHGKNSDEESHS